MGINSNLLKQLKKVDRPGRVCTGGDWSLTMPGLKVDDLGTVGLPLGKTQARKLIKLCDQAPYGKGTETVVDTGVRRAWELDPSRFQLTNPKWDELLAALVHSVQEALGLQKRKLEATLYKLLVYEKGGFFLPHRDGEKLDRMVATLVVCLPAEHEGGELVVSHDDRVEEIAFTGAASGHELSYAAFYSDCQHEIRPVRSGYRLCLTYNLTLAPSQGGKEVVAPAYGETIASIGKLLSSWQDEDNVEKLAITLDHQYTQDGLRLDTLKGIDRVRAEVLFKAAEQAGCFAHLALVTLWQTGTAEVGYDYSYGSRRRNRWSMYDDQAEDDETGDEYEMGEVFDWSLKADHWSDPQGKPVRLGEIHVSKDEIIAAVPLEAQKHDRQNFEGYTGNAGMTLERWYSRATIVIWPRAEHFQVLCAAGGVAAIGGLEQMVQELAEAPKAKRKEQRQECLSFASAIIETWSPVRHAWTSMVSVSDLSSRIFPQLLQRLDAPDLMRRFLLSAMPRDAQAQLDKSFGKFCKQYGWASFEEGLTAVMSIATVGTVQRNAELLLSLSAQRNRDVERINICRRLSEHAVAALRAYDEGSENRDWRYPKIDRAALLGTMVKAMLAIEAEAPLTQLIEHSLTSDKYDLTDAHLAAIFAISSRLVKVPVSNKPITQWLAACRTELEELTRTAPTAPTNYRRSSELSCGCDDCSALSRFLDNPDQQEARFPLAKNRRQHLHNIIDTHGCDCTHVTERIGRPYVLVCTKTSTSYEAACRIYERDIANLARLVELQKAAGRAEGSPPARSKPSN